MSRDLHFRKESIGSERDLDNLSDIPSVLSDSPRRSRSSGMDGRARSSGMDGRARDFGDNFKPGGSKPPHHGHGAPGQAWGGTSPRPPVRHSDGTYSLDVGHDSTPPPSTASRAASRTQSYPRSTSQEDRSYQHQSIDREAVPPGDSRNGLSQNSSYTEANSSYMSKAEDGTPIFSVDVRMPRYGSHMSYDTMLQQIQNDDPFSGSYVPSGKGRQEPKTLQHRPYSDSVAPSKLPRMKSQQDTSESEVKKMKKRKKKKKGTDSLNSTATFVIDQGSQDHVVAQSSTEALIKEDAASIKSNGTYTKEPSQSRQRLVSESRSEGGPLQNSHTSTLLRQRRQHLSKKIKVSGVMDRKQQRMMIDQSVIAEYVSKEIYMRECKKFEPDGKSKDKCVCGRDLTWHLENKASFHDSDGGKHIWHTHTHTKRLPCDSFGDIYFRGFGHFTRNSPYVRLESSTEMEKVWTILTGLWHLPIPKLLISVTGGAKRFELRPRLRAILKQGLVHAAASTGAWIITGGTATGVMGFVGEAVQEYLDTGGEASQNKLIALGIATWGGVANKEALDGDRKGLWPATYAVEDLKQAQKGTAPLDHNHTHFLLVDDGTEGKYGGEIEFRSALEHYVSSKVSTGVTDSQTVQVPVVLVVVEGGINTMQTVYESVKLDTPVVAIEGSGRAADFIALGYKMTWHATNQDNYYEPPNFDEEMKKKARTMFVWKDSDDAIDKKIAEVLRHLKKTLKRRNLLNIFKLSEADSVKDIDRAILYALLKANKNNCYSQLCLALAWDRCDIARQEIFTMENRSKWNPVDLYDSMFMALVHDRPDFVKLFLDNGVDLKKFLTIRTLWKLYARTVTDQRSTQAEILRYLISYVKQTWGAYFCCRDTEFAHSDPQLLQMIGKVLAHLMFDRALNTYDDSKFELKSLPKRKNMRWEGNRNTLSLKSYLSQASGRAMSMGGADDGDLTFRSKQRRRQEMYDFDQPERELFLWSILLNRRELAHLFWRMGTCHLGGALVGCGLLSRLSSVADDEEEIELCTDLEAHAKAFEDLACNVLSDCYARNKVMSHRLLVRQLDHWGGLTVLNLADRNSMMDFTNHTCVQTKLNSIWMGRMALYTEEWKILVCIPLPILVPFIKFATNRELCLDDIWDNEEDEDEEEDEEGLGQMDLNEAPSEERGRQEIEMKPHASNQVQPAEPLTDEGVDGAIVAKSPLRRKTGLKTRLYKVKLFDYSSNDISLFSAILYFYAAPATKMIAAMISYLIFLGIFSYFVLVELKEDSFSIVEFVTWAWLITMFIEEIRQIFAQGQMEIRHRVVSWFSNMWNRFDLLIYIVFIVSVSLRYSPLTGAFGWARVFYSISLILFYIRFLHFFFAHKTMGPKVIMIWRMLTDLMFFVFLLAVFILGFGVAYHANLYPNSSPTWNILVQVLYLPYWQMYGELFLDRVEGGEDPPGCTRNETIWRDDPTQRCPESNWLVTLLLAVYMVLTNILLLNLLIAMFSYTFQTVQDNATKVWRFYRLSLISEYSHRPTLAPPFIIFNHIWRLFRLCCKGCHKSDPLMTNLSQEEMIRLNTFERIGVDNYLIKKAHMAEERLDSKVTNAANRIDRVMDELGHIKESLQQQEQHKTAESTAVAIAEKSKEPPAASREKIDEVAGNGQKRRRQVSDVEYLRHCVDDLGSQVTQHSRKLDALIRRLEQVLPSSPPLPKKQRQPPRTTREASESEEEPTSGAPMLEDPPSVDC